MTDSEAKNKIFGICNSLDAISGYFRNSEFSDYAQLLMGAKEFILEGLEKDDKGLEQCDKCDYFISVEEAYKQGRADAFDEFATEIINIIDGIGYVNRISINQIKEQLKEQK